MAWVLNISWKTSTTSCRITQHLPIRKHSQHNCLVVTNQLLVFFLFNPWLSWLPVFKPSMFLCPLSPDFRYIVSPTTHVFQLWLHYLYIYHSSHWPTTISFFLYAIVTLSLQGLFFLDYSDQPSCKLLRNAGTYKTVYDLHDVSQKTGIFVTDSSFRHKVRLMHLI
jgi:hypothetical protein